MGSPPSAHVSLSYRFEVRDRAIVYTGDTGPSRAVEAFARGVDLLVTEMIDLDTTLARMRHFAPTMGEPQVAALAEHLATQHLGPDEVGRLASNAGVSRVVVTHLVPGTIDEYRIAGYLSRIGSGFRGSVVIAADLQSFAP